MPLHDASCKHLKDYDVPGGVNLLRRRRRRQTRVQGCDALHPTVNAQCRHSACQCYVVKTSVLQAANNTPLVWGTYKQKSPSANRQAPTTLFIQFQMLPHRQSEQRCFSLRQWRTLALSPQCVTPAPAHVRWASVQPSIRCHKEEHPAIAGCCKPNTIGILISIQLGRYEGGATHWCTRAQRLLQEQWLRTQQSSC